MPEIDTDKVFKKLKSINAPKILLTDYALKRLKMIVAKNKTQQKGQKALIARLFKKSPNTNN